MKGSDEEIASGGMRCRTYSVLLIAWNVLTAIIIISSQGQTSVLSVYITVYHFVYRMQVEMVIERSMWYHQNVVQSSAPQCSMEEQPQASNPCLARICCLQMARACMGVHVE